VLTKYNDRNVFEIFKAHSMGMITSMDKEALMKEKWH